MLKFDWSQGEGKKLWTIDLYSCLQDPEGAEAKLPYLKKTIG